MTEYIFSYGTLQDGEVQMELFGRHLIGHTDILKGYNTTEIELNEEGFVGFSEREKYLIASISDDEKDAIEGTALEVTMDELLLADEYEPEEYKRELVTLESGKQAWIYLRAAERKNMIERERIEMDVVFVGAGPANLAAALHLKN